MNYIYLIITLETSHGNHSRTFLSRISFEVKTSEKLCCEKNLKNSPIIFDITGICNFIFSPLTFLLAGCILILSFFPHQNTLKYPLAAYQQLG